MHDESEELTLRIRDKGMFALPLLFDNDFKVFG
jgi:hypothetical protein